MRLTRIEIDGFGNLRDFRAEIAPGLHLFHGPNEAGKSTLQQAILALLYGFYGSERAKAAENKARERFVPWAGGRYAARLEYSLSDGVTYRVERDFSTRDVATTLWDLAISDDVTDRYGRGRGGNVPFAQKQIGMSKEVFQGCAFVSQGELYEITEGGETLPGKIGETIVSLADSARRDVSAQSAMSRLDGILKERVGSSRARKTPLPVARGALNILQGELAEIRDTRAAVADDAARLEETQREEEQLQEALLRSRYLIAQAEIAELENQISQLNELASEQRRLEAQMEENARFATFPAEERHAVQQRWNTIDETRQRLERDKPDVERATARLEELAEERAKSARRADELAHLQDVSPELEEQIEELARGWRQASTIAREAARRLADASVSAEDREECERLSVDIGHLSADDLARLAERMRAPSPGWPQRIGRAIVAAMRWLGRQAAALWRLAVRVIARRPAEPVVVRPAPVTGDTLDADDIAVLLSKHLRYRELAPQLERYRDEERATTDAQASLDAAAGELRTALAGLVEDRTNLDAALHAFARRVEEHRERENITRELESSAGERTSLLETTERHERERDSLSRKEKALEEEIRRAISRDVPLAELVAAFVSGAQQRKRYDDAKDDLEDHDTQRGMLLRGRSPGELSAALEKARAESASLLQATPSLEGAQTDESADALNAAADEQRSMLSARKVEVGRLETAIDTRMTGLRHPAEVEEEVGQREREVAALERFGEELAIARDAIDEAMTASHRDYAPEVSRLLSEHIAQVTGGRYQEVGFNPSDLRPMVRAPETGNLVDVDDLSRGTRAAIYLLLRIGLAQYMSVMHEPIPVILDDPLVDLDDLRLESFLDLLLTLTDDVQILLFTKDADALRWFSRRCAGNERHGSTALTGPPAGDALPAHLRAEPDVSR